MNPSLPPLPTDVLCALKPARVEEVEEEGYLNANPDVRQVGMTAQDHWLQYGAVEGRVQWMNEAEVRALREAKLARVRFKGPPHVARAPGACADFLPSAVRAQFAFPDTPPISANPYGEFLNREFREHPGKLFLDVGAGLRQRYFANVVNTEIWPAVCTDVLCVGEDLPFADEVFDKVLCLAVLEHTLRPWEVAREICRVLKPGGEVLIDYPFLQPMHGYPHHYFNATPSGHRSLFEPYCDIQEVKVRPNQLPIHALHWLVLLWRNGLPPADAAVFENLTVRDLLAHPPAERAAEPWCANLPEEVRSVIAAGTTLVAVKKFRAG